MPAGVAANDVVVAQVTARGGTLATIAAPGGWTSIRRDDSGTALAQQVFYRVAQANESGPYSFTITPGDKASGGIAAYRGVVPGAPVADHSGQANGTGTNVTAPAVSAGAANTMLVGVFGSARGSGTAGTNWTPPGGMSERWDESSTGNAAGSRTSSEGADQTVGSGGTGTRTAVNAGSAVGIGQLVALAPDGGNPTVTAPTITETHAHSHAVGTTFYYRPAGGGSTFTVAVTASDPSGSGIQHVSFPGLAGGFTPATSLDKPSTPYERTYTWQATTGTESGSKTITAVDNGDNTATTTFTITPDSSAPAPAVSFPAASAYRATTWNAGCATSGFCGAVTADGGSGLAKVEVSLRRVVDGKYWDGSGFVATETFVLAAGTSTWSYAFPATSFPADGDYALRARATDNVGNAATSAEVTFTYDSTAPSAPSGLTSSPSSPANDNGPEIAGSADAGSTVELFATSDCSGAAAATGTAAAFASPGLTVSVPNDSTTTFRARATDPAGNASPCSTATVTYVEDSTAPGQPSGLSVLPASPANDNAPRVSGTADAGTTVRLFATSDCSGAAAATGTDAGFASPGLMVSVSDDTSTTFKATATDAAGNVSACSAASVTFVEDSTAPDTTVDSGPTGTTNQTSATFAFGASEAGSRFECNLDGAGWSACASPETYAGLADGGHTFEVRATDPAENVDGLPASRAWTVDTAAPDTAIESAPTDPSGPSVTFAFGASEAGVTFECDLDEGGWASCYSPKSYAGLSEGSHAFRVRAVDGAGNGDPSPATRDWSVDRTAPDTTIDSGPTGTTNATSATFAFGASEGGSTFECSLDGAAWASCTAPATYSGLAGGDHTFEVRATDAVGNTDGTPATRSWTVDASAPETTIDSGPTGATNQVDATFTFSADEPGSSFQCSLDEGAWVACSSPKTYTGLADAEHTLDVRAIDPAGNPDDSPASRAWTVDTDAPDTSIDTGPSGSTIQTDATFTFSADEPGSSFACRLDEGAWEPCSSPETANGLADGSHTFEVRATDAAGNTDAFPATRTWSVDTAGPETTIDSGPADPSGSASAAFAFDSDEPGSTFECRLEEGAWASCSSPETYSGLADGNHVFDVRAIDPAGNADGTPARRTWLIDTTPPSDPTLSFDSFAAAVASGATVYYRPGAAAGQFRVAASSSDPQTGVSSYAFPAPAAGWSVSGTGAARTYAHTGSPADPAEPNEVRATNGAGTPSGATSFTVTPDASAPTTSVRCGGVACSAGWYAGTVSVTLSASDAGAGVQEIRYTTDGSDPTPVDGTLYVAAFDVSATTSVKFRAYDAVGNEEAVGSQHVRIDPTAPAPPTLSFGSFENASASASTVFYRPGVAGGFTVSAAAEDSQSGIDRVSFPGLGAGWSGGGDDSSAPYEGAYTFASGASDPAEPNDVTATNGAALVSEPASFTVTADGLAPVGSIRCNGAACSD
nr:Ig-like domain repeat protein [Actinomycetota bacterium]